VGHRPRGHEGLLDEAAGGELVRLPGATQRGEDVELPALEGVPGEGAHPVEVEEAGEPGDAGEDVEGLDVEDGELPAPGIDDGVDVVGRVVATAHPRTVPVVVNLDIKVSSEPPPAGVRPLGSRAPEPRRRHGSDLGPESVRAVLERAGASLR